MPLFFFISGVFFSPQKFSVSRSAIQLLVPFILFNTIALIISFAVGSISSGHLKLPNIDFFAILHGCYPIGPSWFLLSLCILRVYAGLLLRYLSDFTLVLLSLGLLVAFFFTQSAEVWSVLGLGSAVLGLPFYLVGFYLKKIVSDLRRFSKWYLLLLTLVISILAEYNGLVGIHASEYGNSIFLFILFGVSGSMSIILLSTWVKLPKRLISVFMDGALFFICMHTLVFEYIILCWNKLTGDFSGNTLAEKVVFTILTFAVSFPLIELMMKFMPELLGKTRSNTSIIK